jgi:predicted Zn-dependent protease with MMP-like domain
MQISNEQFERLVSWAIDSLPSQYIDNVNNLAFVIEDEPTEEQKQKLNLGSSNTLYGLYEGIPLTKRNGNYSLVLPDKITIFKRPILQNSENLQQLKKQIKETVWHEIAHHYGLNHQDINQRKSKKSK